jgi:uncharacterized membrane protein
MRPEAGQSLIFVLLMLPVFLGLLGIVIDGAHVFGEKRRTQGAADAAALAAAQSIVGTTGAQCPGSAVLITDVESAAECSSRVNDGPTALEECTDPHATNCFSWPVQG